MMMRREMLNMTNLEKLKTELIEDIQRCSAEEFEDKYIVDDFPITSCREQHGEDCPYPIGSPDDCQRCSIEWLNREVTK